MSYLGITPSQATRSRYYYTASGGETSISGADDNSNVLTFTDGNYVDVSLNGAALVAGTDYNTTTANTIAGLAALAASDVVEVIVYGTFSVFGGNMAADLNFKDNVKINMGTGNDLQIYHDGSNSIINDVGTGELQLQVAGTTRFNTTATGVNVTGSVTADAITLPNNGTIDFGATTCRITGEASGTDTITFNVNGVNLLHLDGGGNVGIGTTSPGAGVDVAYSGTAAAFRVYNSQATNPYGLLVDNTAADTSDSNYIADFRSGGTTRLRVQNNGNVGIGDSSPYEWSSVQPSLNLRGISASFPNRSGALIFKSQAGTHMTVMDFETGNDLRWYQSSNSGSSWDERMRLDSNGNVGIGESSLSGNALEIRRSGKSGVVFKETGVAQFYVEQDTDAKIRVTNSKNLIFSGGANGTTERMRLDSSGRLLVGTTSTPTVLISATSGGGIALDPDSYSAWNREATASNHSHLVFNQTGVDAQYLQFRKDGSTVGNIGTNGTRFYLAGSGRGIAVDESAYSVLPVNTSGSNNDGGVGLGSSSARFSNLYLSGGVYLGGTGSANYLDDYEEGTWTPGLGGATYWVGQSIHRR
jgi:hypothetical protein